MEFNEEFYENMYKQASAIYHQMKEIKEIGTQVKLSEANIMKVGAFVVEFYNEYREHDALSMPQIKEMKLALHKKTSEITQILCPRMEQIRKRGNPYLVEWNKVNKGLWSIYKTRVNGVSIPYDRTPKVKFQQALEYINNLTVADYLAYRDVRWDDILEFNFTETLLSEKITLENVINGLDITGLHDDDDNNGSPAIIH